MKTGTLSNNATPASGVFLAIAILAGCGKDGAVSTASAAPLQGPEPVITLSIDPTAVVRGSLATIQWSVTNATECLASGEWYGKRPISGSEVFTSRENGKIPFTLTCTGAGGTASKTVKLTAYRAISPPQ